MAVACGFGAIGADSRWLATLGRAIVGLREVPDGVPYASAPSADWPNVLVAAELLFNAFDALGERGFVVAQAGAVGVAFAVLALDARRRGAPDAGAAIVLLLAVVGAFTSIAVVRLQLFSIALFPTALLLLREETRRPSRRIWLLVPLVAAWGNLHGAVLVVLAVATAYLLFERARSEPLVAAGVWCASVLALFATPELWRTFDYYRGVLENEAARRGFGLWEPLDPRSGFDLVLIAVAAVLLVLAVRSRPRLWELVALAGLTLLTVRTARSGVWLLFAAAVPASSALSLQRRLRPRIATGLAVAVVAVAVAGLVRGPIPTGMSSRARDAALAAAAGTPILADGLFAEQLVLAGGRVWLANPLDAFSARDQKLYVDWLEGLPSGAAALDRAPRVVVVTAGSDAEALTRVTIRAREVARDETAVVYLRRR